MFFRQGRAISCDKPSHKEAPMTQPDHRYYLTLWSKLTLPGPCVAWLALLVLLAPLCSDLYAKNGAIDKAGGIMSIKLDYPEAMSSEARVQAVKQAFGHGQGDIYASLEGMGVVASILDALDATAQAQVVRKKAVTLAGQHLEANDPARIRQALDLAQDYIRARNYDQAVLTAQDALSTVKEARGQEADPSLTWLSMAIIARGLFGQGKYDLSINFYEMALKLAEQDKANHSWAPLWIMASLESVYARSGDKSKAEDTRKAYLTAFNNIFNSGEDKAWPNIRHMARAFFSHGDYSMAQGLYEMIYPHTARLYGPTSPYTVGTLMQLYHVYCRQANYKRAKDALDKLIAGQKEELGLAHPDTVMSLDLLAAVYAKLNNTSAARQTYELTLPYLDRYFSREDPYYSYFMYRLADLYYSTDKDYAKARGLLEKSLPPMLELYGRQNPILLDPMQILAGSYYNLGMYEQANEYHELMLPILEQLRGPNHQETIWLLGMMEKTYTQLGQKGKAEAIRQKISTLQKRG